MARSLGLAAYRALSRRGEVPVAVPATPRPVGELVWIHAGEVSNLLAVRDLAQRLVAARQNLSVLITYTPLQKSAPVPPAPSHWGIIESEVPGEHPAAVAAFLDHWHPEVGIWIWGDLRPNLILDAYGRDCPLYLIDADVAGFDRRRNRWLPDLTRQVLACFVDVFARSGAGYKRMIQLGVDEAQVQQTSSLMAGGQALGCSESDLAELSMAMGGRPAWFAANILPQELPIVLAAHKQASRLSHRLLLILQPSTQEDASKTTEILAGANFATARWDEGQFPDETAQVLLTEDPTERGLFYRVAPVSFLGSTLAQGVGGCDPLDAAALGSAILYGPKVRHFMPSYSRLAAAGAARIINDADALGAAVSSLIVPDHAAAMAHAGWDVISQGASLTDRVVDLVQDTLDVAWGRP